MTVRRVSLHTVMPENPRWMLYLVPKSRASMTDWQKFQTWGEAMDAMRALSVAPAQVRNEDCWVVLFALDRLPPGGRSATLDGRAMTFVSKDFAGWPVLSAKPGRVRPDLPFSGFATAAATLPGASATGVSF